MTQTSRSEAIISLAFALASAFEQSGKIATRPLFRDPVFDGAADPALVWHRARKKWLMFYTNRRAGATELPGFSWVHGTKIGIAESADGGATWRYAGTAEVSTARPITLTGLVCEGPIHLRTRDFRFWHLPHISFGCSGYLYRLECRARNRA